MLALALVIIWSFSPYDYLEEQWEYISAEIDMGTDHRFIGLHGAFTNSDNTLSIPATGSCFYTSQETYRCLVTSYDMTATIIVGSHGDGLIYFSDSDDNIVHKSNIYIQE